MDFSGHANCRMPLAKAAAIWAQRHGIDTPARAKVQRWVRRGLRGILLNAELFGGRLWNRPADFELFHEAVNAAAAACEGGAE